MIPAGPEGAARPFTLRLYERVPLPPAGVGVLLGLAYLLVLGLLCLATGRFYQTPLRVAAPWSQPGWWVELVNATLVGLGSTILVLSLQGARRDLHDLAPLLGGDEAAVAARVTWLSQRRMRLVGGVVVIGALAFTYLDPGLWSDRPRPGWSDPFFLWLAARQVGLAWILARAMYADVSTARAFGRVAASLREVDLLDTAPLTPFARRGVRSVLFWMAGTSLFSLFWAAPNPGTTNFVSFAVFVGVAAAAFLHPLQGIRLRIRAAKREALARIRREIRADQRRLLEGGAEAGPAAVRLPALFAAEARTEAAREWPFDASTFARFLLYAAVGIGSWVGGAVVDLLLSTVLE